MSLGIFLGALHAPESKDRRLTTILQNCKVCVKQGGGGGTKRGVYNELGCMYVGVGGARKAAHGLRNSCVCGGRIGGACPPSVCPQNPGDFPTLVDPNFAPFGHTEVNSGSFAPTGVGIRSSADAEYQSSSVGRKENGSSSVRRF